MDVPVYKQESEYEHIVTLMDYDAIISYANKNNIQTHVFVTDNVLGYHMVAFILKNADLFSQLDKARHIVTSYLHQIGHEEYDIMPEIHAESDFNDN